ncbi:mitochondrial proton/calcium exchanger protein isoform X2 [Anopheles moucheti]|uniref:mitochondrial proton/calcium exchanger protein isoform X2 n=1 Tax=Anopheles moucheti TaxID=186751 RepID=UPI0022F0B517|nr:mitochondrial proton/calcium exchanger protein isoform X2 [Anopheles moucheti]
MSAILRNQSQLLGMNRCYRNVHPNARVRFVSYRTKTPVAFISAQYDSLLQPCTIFSVNSNCRRPVGACNGGLPLLDALGYGRGSGTLSPQIIRCISTTSWLQDQPSSKVEVTVQTLKKKEKEQQQQQQLANGAVNGVPVGAAVTTGTSAPASSTNVLSDSATVMGAPSATTGSSPATNTEQQQTPPAAAVVAAAPVVKKTLQQRIWAELVHYYHGFRLLFIDINISRKLLWRVLNGKTLTRREHKLLIRTTSDLFRLVPFSVFIIVPFMELLLPLAIKLFPGMLPSTFQTATEREDKIKQNLKVKIEMAKFLQKTLDDMAVQNKEHRSQAAKDFSEFFTRIRTTENFTISNEEILKFSKLFEDEITLDSLTRQQLQALCRVLEVSPIGTSNLLRFQLRLKLRNLAADDRTIQKEGIESLNLSELQAACRARGMRAYGASEERLKSQLQEWINLSLNEKVPPSLLLLSRALVLPENITTSDKLKATISSLPDSVATVTKAAIGEREGKIDNKTKIEVIKEEERKIKEEREEEKEKQKEQQELVDGAPVLTADGKMATEPTSTTTVPEQPEIIFAPAPSRTIVLDQIPPQPHTVPEISSKDLEVLGDALGTLSKDKKSLLVEKEEIRDLKEEIADYQEDVQELQEVVTAARNQEEVQVKESRAAKLLFRKVNSMINRMDTVMTELERKEKQLKEKMHAAEQSEELQKPQAADEELVRIDELMSAIKKIQNVTDDSRLDQISKILGKIDDDQDGQIKVEDVLKVIETIGKENVKLNAKQVDELIDLLDKEEELEAEDKIEKALTKSLEAKEKQKEQKEKEKEKLLELTDKATDLSALASPPSPTTKQLDDGTTIIDADALQKVVEERKKNASINGTGGGSSAAGSTGAAGSTEVVVPPPTATQHPTRPDTSAGAPKDKMI